jgi:hypothetical protein
LVGLIEDVTTYAPEFSVVPAITRPGTVYRVTRRTDLPASAFRAVNDAATLGKSAFKQELKEMFFLDTTLQVDEAAVLADDGSAGDFLTQEAQAALQAATITIGKQMYYGTTADAKGFVGLQTQSVGKWPTGGTTNSTSAYLVWLNPQGVQFVVGKNGNISLPAWARQAVTPTTTTQKFCWVSNLSGFIGLQVGSAAAVWRVSGITAAAPLTDARGAGLLSKVPLSRRNGLRWFMNRMAAYTLAASRASLGFAAPTSGGSPTQQIGPMWPFMNIPEQLAGVPITVTDSLVDTETNAGSADAYAVE